MIVPCEEVMIRIILLNHVQHLHSWNGLTQFLSLFKWTRCIVLSDDKLDWHFINTIKTRADQLCIHIASSTSCSLETRMVLLESA